MKFSTREDIDAPIEHVFRAVSNFDAFEKSAMRRGAEIQREEHVFPDGIRTSWQAVFPYRGKMRPLKAKLVELDSPTRLAVESESGGLDGDLVIDLMALSRSRTRLKIQLEMRPRTMTARLVLQSLKLAKASLTRKFKLRIARFAMEVEDQYKGPQLYR